MANNDISSFEAENTGSAFETVNSSSAFETANSSSAFENDASSSAFELNVAEPKADSAFVKRNDEATTRSNSNGWNYKWNNHSFYVTGEKELSEQGAMGKVFKAEMREGSSKTNVVVKKLYRHPNDSEANYQSRKKFFLNESKMTCDYARGCGSNVVHGHFYGEIKDTPFMVLDFYDSVQLKQWLAGKTIFTHQIEFKTIMKGILEGVVALHKAEIIHRDLKTENVVVRKSNGEPVILDLGLARKVNIEDLVGLKKIGTEGYAAPEQLNGTGATYVSDVYSVGIIFCEMLTGSPKIENLKQLSPALRSYRKFIEKCVISNPANRYKNAIDALDVLKRICATDVNAQKNDNSSKSRIFIGAVIVAAIVGFIVFAGSADEKSKQNVDVAIHPTNKIEYKTKTEQNTVVHSEQSIPNSAPIVDVEKMELTDTRDGQKYPLIKIDNLLWTAKNLNFSAGETLGFCYEKAQTCSATGRLYEYKAAKKVCPEGFRLPTKEDAESLVKKGLVNDFDISPVGFFQKMTNDFYKNDDYLGIWTSTAHNNVKNYVLSIMKNEPLRTMAENIGDGYSVRCVK